MVKRTRDPERIEKVINLLKTYWDENPDLRLGQILENIAGVSYESCFYMEDQIVINYLIKQLEEKKK